MSAQELSPPVGSTNSDGSAGAPAAAGPIGRAHGEVAAGVFWVAQEVLDGKNGVVIGSRAALAIDSGNSPADGQAMVDLIRALGHEPVRLALTHGHGDHVIGSSAFRGALDVPARRPRGTTPTQAPLSHVEVFAHARTAAVIRRHLPRLAEHHQRPDLASEITWPTVAFTEELTIDLGGKTVRLVSSPGHSEDSAYAYVVEDRILFSGDTCVTIIPPVIADGDSRQLEASLRRMADLGVEILVPGHGPLVTGRAAVHAALLWPADYVAAVRSHVQTLVTRGESPEAIVDACPYDRFVGDRFAGINPRGEKPHQLTVAKIVSEVRAELRA